MDLRKRLAAEAAGTALLLAIGGGAGIAAARLAHGDAALALLASSAMSSAGLAVLILTFGSVSGSHFNPLLTLAEACGGRLPFRFVLPYWAAQLAGALAGAATVHAMFGLAFLAPAIEVRTGPGAWLGEGLASFGLLCVFIGCGNSRPVAAPFAVATYVMAACWSSSSGAFMNPALTLARALGSAGGGIRPEDVPAYLLAQLGGAAAAGALMAWLHAPAERGKHLRN